MPDVFEGEMIMRKILVVDDEQAVLVLARRVLSPKYKIVTARNGPEAVKAFEQERPDLILTDLRMPEMNGYELHRILQEKTSEPVPIIFMTADESDESESKGFAVGAADYIRKPWKSDVLLRRVGNIIDNLDKIHGLEAAVSTDIMTGLLNKAASQREIANRIQQAPGALLMIDLDNFKLVNDIYGHHMGDIILVRFAELIKEVIRSDDLAGRMGGDEFIAYLQNVHEEKPLQEKTVFLNQQLLSSAKKFMGEDMEIPLGVSVGAVFSPDEGTDFDTLYQKADRALYEVKQHGKHECVVYGLENRCFAKEEQLSQMRMILGERNVEQGAYFVDFENFKMIYRLLSRIASRDKQELQLMQFTLKTENSADEFRPLLLQALRNSDCVAQSGKQRFLALSMGRTIEACKETGWRIITQFQNLSSDQVAFECEKV